MKSKTAVLVLAVVALFTPACEKHKWTETKVLFQDHKEEGHEAQAGAHDEAKGEAHAAEKKHE